MGGWWGLDEVIEPSLQPMSSRVQKIVHVAPTPVELESDDVDKKSLELLANLVGRQVNVLLLSGTVILSCRSCCWTTMNL